MKSINLVLVISLVLLIQSCASFSYTNKELISPTNKETMQSDLEIKATFNVAKDRGSHQEALVILSLSGGGSRAAYWSSSIMLGLEDVFSDEGLNILKEVDIISSVSGGSLPAAYYVISKEPGDTSGKVVSNRNWEADTVKDLMTRNYRRKWLGNWFWPSNIFKYWFTAFDRSDIMAQTLADNMFDVKTIGFDLKFKDVNPDRPYIVLNATNGTTEDFSNVFTFTYEDFKDINSDINEYHIGRAVMATASFPAVFNYMTLKNFMKSNGKDAYVHVFDGGNSDNLGLKSVIKILDKNKDKYKKIVVILIDSFTESKGVNSKDYDARKFFDYAVDLNFIDSMDTLLANNRQALIDNLKDTLKMYRNHEIIFYHIKFADIKDKDLKKKLNSIRTDFKIDKSSKEAIDKAVKMLIVKDNNCLKAIKDILIYESTNHRILDCRCERQFQKNMPNKTIKRTAKTTAAYVHVVRH